MTSTEATELLDRVRSGNTLRNPTLQALLAAAIEITSGLSPEQLRRKSLPADHAERLSSLDDSCRTARQTGTVPSATVQARLWQRRSKSARLNASADFDLRSSLPLYWLI